MSKHIKAVLFTSLFFAFLIYPKVSYAAVAFDASSESHTGTTGSTSEASFSWSHNPVVTPEGVVVFVYTVGTSTPYDTSVTYGGTSMSLVSGGAAADTATEPAVIRTYFLGASVPSSDPATIVVNRTNNATTMYAIAFSVNSTSTYDTEVYTAGIVLLQENGAASEQSVDDGSIGTNSVRFAAGYTGKPDVPTAGASSTLTHDIDFGAYAAGAVYETTAGQGSRSVGVVTGNDDLAVVHLAVREILPTYNISGLIYQSDESSLYLCSTTGNLTVNLRVNGSGSYTTTCTADTGAWSITGVTVTSGQTVTIYTDAGSVRASHYLVSDGSTKADVHLFTDRVILRDDANGSITNTEINSGETSDSDDLVTVSAGAYSTSATTYETHIYGGDTYAPGGDVSTGKLHIPSGSTYSGSTETLTLQGTGTGTSRPLYVDSGTFTTPDITDFEGAGDVGVEGTTYDALTFTPTITGATAYTFTAGATINGNFTANPTAASTQVLTVNLGGTTTVGTAYTTSLTGTTSGESVLETTSGSSHAFSTGLLNIAALGGLTANNSTITLTGTSGTLFTYATGDGSGFSAGGSTVVMNPNAAVTLFSADPTLYNLSLTPTIDSARIYTVGSALTINNDFTINPGTAANLLTVNMGGNITVAATGTTTITRTTSATSSLVTTASNYNLSTGFLNVAAGGTLTAAGSTSTITLSGTSGTLFTLDASGTFTAGSSTVVFDPNASVTLFSTTPTLYNLSLTPTLVTTGKTYTVGTALTINGDFTINPGTAALLLTVNAGGNITGAATTTTTITGTTSSTSTLDLRPVTTDYNLTTGLLDIASAGTLDATGAASTITLSGTAGTLFTIAGDFVAGSSTVLVNSASGTPTFNSGVITGADSFYNLTFDGTNVTTTTATDDITVTNTLNVATGDTLSLASGQILTHSGTTLTLDGTISGVGTLYYSSASAFPSGGTYSAGLRFDATNTDHILPARTYGANVELYSNSGASDRTFTLSATTTTFSGNLTLNAANTNAITLSGSANNPTINITGNLDSTNGGGAENITTGTGTWTVSGNVDFTDVNTFTATAGNTLQMNGSAKTITSASETLQNFAVTGNSVSNVDIMDVNGTFDVSAGAIFTHGAGADIDINIAGDFTIADTATWTENVTSTSQVIFDGDLSYADNNSDTKESIGNVVIGLSPDTTNLTTDFAAESLTVTSADVFNTCEYEVDIGAGGITIDGTFDASATGTTVACSGNEGDETTINNGGNFTISATGSLVQDASTLITDNTSGTQTVTLDGESLYNLTASSTGTTQFSDTIDIGNDLLITAGTLDLNNQTVTIDGNFDNDAAMTDGTASVTFTADSDGSVTIDADGTGSEAFYNITFNGTGDTFQITTLLDVDNDFTITNGTFDANGQALNIQGSYSNSGTFTSNSNTTTFDDTDGGETLAGTMTGSSSFYNLIFNDGVASGAWSFGANSATVTNDFTITGGTVTAPSTTLTIGKNFDNQDGFTHNSGTVEFNNSGNTSILTYAATTTFNNFTVQTASKAMQFEETDAVVTDINGTFTVQGSACGTKITLNSESGAADWEIDLTGASVDVDYSTITYSNSVTAVSAANSTSGGNNTNWTITEDACAPVEVGLFGGSKFFSGVRIKP